MSYLISFQLHLPLSQNAFIVHCPTYSCIASTASTIYVLSTSWAALGSVASWWRGGQILPLYSQLVRYIQSAVCSSGLLGTKEIWSYWSKSSKQPQRCLRDWSICQVRRGWESWDWLAWRTEGSRGALALCINIWWFIFLLFFMFQEVSKLLVVRYDVSYTCPALTIFCKLLLLLTRLFTLFKFLYFQDYICWTITSIFLE